MRGVGGEHRSLDNVAYHSQAYRQGILGPMPLSTGIRGTKLEAVVVVFATVTESEQLSVGDSPPTTILAETEGKDSCSRVRLELIGLGFGHPVRIGPGYLVPLCLHPATVLADLDHRVGVAVSPTDLGGSHPHEGEKALSATDHHAAD